MAEPPSLSPVTHTHARSRHRSSRPISPRSASESGSRAFRPQRCSRKRKHPARRSISPGTAGYPTTPTPRRCCNSILDDSSFGPTFKDPAYQRKLANSSTALRPRALPHLRQARPRSRPQRSAAGRFRQPDRQRLLLRSNRLPDLRDLRHGPRSTLPQARPTLSTKNAQTTPLRCFIVAGPAISRALPLYARRSAKGKCARARW